MDDESMLDEEFRREQVLTREYMRACLRIATGDSRLDSLGDEELRATWLLGGKPRLSYDDWKLAMFPEPEQAPDDMGPPEPTEDEKRNANEKFMESIRRKRLRKAQNGVDDKGKHTAQGSAGPEQGDNAGTPAPAVDPPKEPVAK
jgi:hypothetical protein